MVVGLESMSSVREQESENMCMGQLNVVNREERGKVVTAEAIGCGWVPCDDKS